MKNFHLLFVKFCVRHLNYPRSITLWDSVWLLLKRKILFWSGLEITLFEQNITYLFYS